MVKGSNFNEKQTYSYDPILRSRWTMMLPVRKSALYLFMVISLFLSMTACSGTSEIGAPPPDAVCSSMVNAKCTRCHYKTRICDALGSKSVGQWVRSIKFMIKQGAQLTDDERNKIIACLSSLPSGSEVVCQ